MGHTTQLKFTIRMKTIKVVLTIGMLFIINSVIGQGINSDKVSLENFLKRMYNAAPFDGVKIVDDYDNQYIVSVIRLEKAKYTNEMTMNRVAQVKAQSQASTFINGASISMDLVISTKETEGVDGNIDTMIETIEHIKQNSVGFSQGLELLTSFDDSDGSNKVYIYFRKIEAV